MPTEDDIPIILNADLDKFPFRCLAAIGYRALLRALEVLDRGTEQLVALEEAAAVEAACLPRVKENHRNYEMTLNKQQESLCAESMWDFSDLKAVFLNCTLKKSPEMSHTQGLIDISKAILVKNRVTVDELRPVDFEIATGVWPDMTEHGWEKDDWPAISDRIMSADILVIGTSIWLGEKTSVATQVIERLYATSHLLNEHGQYAYYGRVGGCLVTGNEDGAKHCAMNLLYSLQHLGYVIPPQADAAWLGEAGPGPSYLDSGSGGPENDFTNRNTTFMTWNLMHLARMMKDAGGIPAHGNQRSMWDAGCRSNFANPAYR